MKKLKGPDLKMPSLRVPDFLFDLYYDLRDRRLLPLVALGLVAIVAVPFLLSGGSDEEAPEGEAGASASALEESSGAELTVVKATPGLRDYRKRLRDRSPTDPFEQRYTAPEAATSGLAGGAPSPTTSSSSSIVSTTTSSETTKSSGSTTTTTQTTEASPGGSTTTESTTRETHPVVPVPDGKGGASPGEVTLYSFAIDVKLVRTATAPDGSKEKDEPETRERVLPPAPLPSAKTQAVTYMGINPTTRQPLLLISDQVTGTFGEGKCLSGASTCQLLEVETGMPITFVFGPDAARYKLTILKVEPVATSKP